MYVYLSKKIAIPNSVRLRCISWNTEQGWIACGGDNGLLKVLKLEGSGTLGRNGGNNLSMNQTLEGHENAVVGVVAWNDQQHKLTSSDANGLIIVWMLHKGIWFEEMINNRNKSVVRDLCWTPDGSKICIVYEDGAVIVGSHDGNRLWGKELRRVLTHVAWSPDSRVLLFGTQQGEVLAYDCVGGQNLAKIQIHCVDETASIPLCGIHWYDGLEGHLEANQPCLVVAYENGRCQIMRNELDTRPIMIDTSLRTTRVRWNAQGSILAIGGTSFEQTSEKKDTAVVQFYTPWGVHIRTLRLPGSGISGLSWEGTGLRLAIAVDSFIYIANIRPEYKWAFMSKTVVYSYTRIERPESVIVFWNVKRGERNSRSVKNLCSIQSTKDLCLVVSSQTSTSEALSHGPLSQTNGPLSTIHVALCNSIGSPLDFRNVELNSTRIVSASISSTHICLTTIDYVYIWMYCIPGQHSSAHTPITDVVSSPIAGSPRSDLSAGNYEKTFHIDEEGTATKVSTTKDFMHASALDKITASTLTRDHLLVARESGAIHMYKVAVSNVDAVTLVNRFALQCQPQLLSMNCTCNVLAVVDHLGTLQTYTVDPSSYSVEMHQGQSTGFERKDVWDMKWASDNPELLAVMEKTRMYIFRGTQPEEPVLSSAHICSFNKLKIKAISLDDVLLDPEHPHKDYFLFFETKSLRDTRELIANVSLKDAQQFVEDNPHNKLWKIIAEAALQKEDFQTAEKCFVRCSDYQGIQFVKRLRNMDDRRKQEAEIHIYFEKFEEAEKVFRSMDRKDLAAAMRMQLGDWFRVVQLIQEGGGDEELIQYAWEQIGDYYCDRQKWSKALQFYEQVKCYDKLIPLYFQLEDYRSLAHLTEVVQHEKRLLLQIGRMLASVGLCDSAVEAFLKAEEVKMALDCCVELNQWESAIRLAEKHGAHEIGTAYFEKYAKRLAEENQTGQAIELYRRAGQFLESARLLSKLATQTTEPLRAKKLYVLSALDLEAYRRRRMENALAQQQKEQHTMSMTRTGTMSHLAGTDRTTAALPASRTSAHTTIVDTLLTADAAFVDYGVHNPWHGAEAYHFYILCIRQIQQRDIGKALITSMRLMQYDDILDVKVVYSLIALCAFHAKNYELCSRAFVRLETLENRKLINPSVSASTNENSTTMLNLDDLLDARANIATSVQLIAAAAAVDLQNLKSDILDVDHERSYRDLAIQIFSRYPPQDNSPATVQCKNVTRKDRVCGAMLKEWMSKCPSCDGSVSICIASGRSISNQRTISCRVCGHPALETALSEYNNCPLCHTPLKPI